VGCTSLSTKVRRVTPARLTPLFFILLLALFITPVHAGSSGGFNTANANATACNTNCQVSPFAGNDADGTTFQNPFASSAQLFQVGVWVGNILPSRVMILTTSGTPAMTHVTSACNAYPAGACPWWYATAGTSYTVVDNEILSGLGANAFNTINLASPPTVSASQWVAVVFQTTGPTSTGGWLVECEIGCDTNTVLNAEFDFGTPNPTGSYNTATTDGPQPSPIVGASFTTQSSGSLAVTACYGNCGSPAVTLANTNSTHSINFNASITLFYQSQSALNGIVNNVTARVARTYTNGESVTLGLYSVDPSCNGAPFSAVCPGFLQASGTFTNPSKGDVSMPTAFQVQSGQFFGVSITGGFAGLDINNTNTNVNLFQTQGRTPGVIFSETSLGNSLMGLHAWVTGNSVFVGPGTSGGNTGSGGCTVTCYLLAFTTSLGGGVIGGLAGFGIIFGFIAGLTLWATRTHYTKQEGGGIKSYALPMEFLVIIAVLILIAFSAVGALPPYIPLIIIGIVAWLFTSAIWGSRRKGQVGTESGV
jgi:hypothetical protein